MAARRVVESKSGAARTLASAADIRAAVIALRKACPTMRRLHDIVGDPPVRRQASGFKGLAGIVVAQQLSAASAAAIWRRTEGVVKPFRPEVMAALPDEALRGAGLSRPKIRTLRAVSEAAASGALDFKRLHRLPEERMREALTAVSGIGPWTADIYLMFCLGRPDAFAPGDLALQLSAQSAFALESRPGPAEIEALAERWRPWRAVAALILWSYYAHERRR
jgi:DNA-3-methyladenine glycosylase II